MPQIVGNNRRVKNEGLHGTLNAFRDFNAVHYGFCSLSIFQIIVFQFFLKRQKIKIKIEKSII